MDLPTKLDPNELQELVPAEEILSVSGVVKHRLRPVRSENC